MCGGKSGPTGGVRCLPAADAAVDAAVDAPGSGALPGFRESRTTGAGASEQRRQDRGVAEVLLQAEPVGDAVAVLGEVGQVRRAEPPTHRVRERRSPPG
jgi:hypothetical protein